MPTVCAALNEAYELHQSGRLPEAERICRQVLAAVPEQGEAWHLLGAIAFQVQNFNAAAECFEQVIRVAPLAAEGHYNLGAACHEQGDLEKAIHCYRRAIALRPRFAEACNNLANALRDQGKLEEAIPWYRHAVEFNPDLGSAYNNLGNALRDQGMLDEAILSYRRALQLMPDAAETHLNLGNVLLQQHEQIAGALASASRVFTPAREFITAHVELGNALYRLGLRSDAIPYYRRAIALQPDSAEAHNNLGAVLREFGNEDEALACFERALTLEPDLADAHTNLAHVLLGRGELERGWQEYEWRWKTGQLPAAQFNQPRWNGEPLAGRVVLLQAEQGFGDTLQFIRYARLVKELGAAVLLQCPARLKPLLASCPGVDSLFAESDAFPSFDYFSPLLSLPRVFHTTMATIPTEIPYLFPNSALVAKWAHSLSQLEGFRLAINWQGRSGQGAYRQRDIPYKYMQQLGQLPGVALISLQKGEARQEMLASQNSPSVFDAGDDVDIASGAFMDTAAIMKNVDLVITSDTAIAHLAGALGIPVWVVLPIVSDWRWFKDRSDSPWYPTMRLFRQNAHGDLTAIFDHLETELCNYKSSISASAYRGIGK